MTGKDVDKKKILTDDLNNVQIADDMNEIPSVTRLHDDFKPADLTKFDEKISKFLSFSGNGLQFNAEKSTENSDWSMNSEYQANQELYKLNLSSGVQHNEDGVKYTQNAHVEFDNDYGLKISADAANNSGAISGGASVNIEVDNAGISGSYTVDEQGNPTHNIDAYATAAIANENVTTAIHNDRTETALTINDGKKPLLKRDNNPTSDYQEQKESLEETGKTLSVLTQCGYSNEDAGFYTSNSIVTNLGKGNFLNLKFDLSKYKNSAEFLADLKKLMLQYNNSSSESEDGPKTVTHGIDFSYKGEKNVYTANGSVETQYPNGEEATRNFSFGAKASFNRTQFGEFNSGLNGEVEANITQQGYKFGLDGAYNYYGSDHEKSTDYMISSKTTLEKNDNGINFESGLYGALRFNNCRTIIEPHSIFELKKDANGNIVRVYNNAIGFYQQLGKNFDDLVGYVKGGRTIYDGGDEKSYTKILAGLKKKATENLTLNAETNWNSNEKFSGSIGVVYNF